MVLIKKKSFKVITNFVVLVCDFKIFIFNRIKADKKRKKVIDVKRSIW